jgi:hypothetical protein
MDVSRKSPEKNDGICRAGCHRVRPNTDNEQRTEP